MELQKDHRKEIQSVFPKDLRKGRTTARLMVHLMDLRKVHMMVRRMVQSKDHNLARQWVILFLLVSRTDSMLELVLPWAHLMAQLLVRKIPMVYEWVRILQDRRMVRMKE